MSIRDIDKEAGAHAVAPRVSLNNIESAIAARFDLTGDKAIGEGTVAKPATLSLLSLCILVMDNGYVVVGKSIPASSANFNAEYGKQRAYDDAVRQVWPLMGYALREKLWEGEGMTDITDRSLEAAIIDQKTAGAFDGKKYAFAAVIDKKESGWALGVAVANEQGYIPIEGKSFKREAEAKEWADGLNDHIGLTDDEVFAIIASTMGGRPVVIMRQ